MKKLPLILLFVSLCCTSFSQKTFKFSKDKNGQIQIENLNHALARSVYRGDSLPLKVTVKPDANFGERTVDVRIDFLPEIDINRVRQIFLSCKVVDEATGREDFQSRNSRVVWYSHKAIDKKERAFKVKIGGLKANTRFKVTFDILMNGVEEQYFIDQNSIVKTKTAPKDRARKLLFIIDKDLENDGAIDKALEQYMTDAKNIDSSIDFDKVYINDNIQEKGILYNRIKKEHENISAPLNYLFFIGSNAYAYLESEQYDNNNVLEGKSYFQSINFYTQIYQPEYTFDSLENRFVKKSYFYYGFEGLPAVDISTNIAQSVAFDIAFGGIIPNSSTGKKQTILNYFKKLHDYKTLKLTFDKSVLFADTQYDYGEAANELKTISTRWKANDTINVNQKLEYGINNSGSYPQWTNDYLNKLSTKSYEVGIYMGHGSPYLFYFGITPEVIKNLSALNTMLFDFFSCSVGDFRYNNYLAGAFLEKGNTLFVKAYTVPIAIATSVPTSPLVELFKKNEVYRDIERGEYFGDSFLFSFQGLSVQVNLGDPLLKLDPVQVQTQDLASAEVCVGSTIEVPFKINTDATIETDYSVQISDKKGENFAPIPAERVGSAFRITIPESIGYGTNYQLKVVASNKNIVSLPGKAFTINTKPVVEVTRFERKDNFEVVSSSKTGNQWYLDGEKIIGATESVYIPEKVGWYTVEVSVNGCTVMSKPYTVFVGIERPALVMTGNNPACEGDEIKLTAPEGYNTYGWIISNDTIRTTSNQWIAKKSGSYESFVMRGKIASYISYPLAIVINAYPPKPTITIENTGLKSSSPTNNQWFLNGTLLKDSTNRYLKGVYAGQYSVKVTEHGCSTESAAFVVTSSEPGFNEPSVKLYPNPSEGIFYVEIPVTFDEWQLKVYNPEGKLILSRQQSDKNNHKEEINLKNKKGSYILQVTDGIKTKSVKFVVE